MKQLRIFLLGMVCASQIFFILSLHSRLNILKSIETTSNHMKARKEFRQDKSQITEQRMVVSSTESFYQDSSYEDCGFVSQEQWFPHMSYDTEEYQAVIYDSQRQSTSKQFPTLHQAENWLFSQNCPSVSWKIKEGK